LEIQLDARSLVTHARMVDQQQQRSLSRTSAAAPGHQARRSHPEERQSSRRPGLVLALPSAWPQGVGLALRQLLKMPRDYRGRRCWLQRAAHYGLYDSTVSNAILRRIASDYFVLDQR
jgi:hypothetical protein